MKTTLITIVVVSAGIIAWQRHRLGELRETDRTLMQKPSAVQVDGVEAARDAAPTQEDERMATGLSETELVQFTDEVLAHRGDFEEKRFLKLANVSAGDWIAVPGLCESLRRLNSAQLRSVLEAWSGGKTIMGGFGSASGSFVMMVERVNPAALAQLYFDDRQEGRVPLVNRDPGFALQLWLQADPAGLWQWAQAAGPAVSGDEKCAVWAAAANVLHDPSAETMRRLCTFQSYTAESAIGLVAKLLPSDEARVRLLQTLHAATGGNVKDMGRYIYRLTERTPFAKLAAMADAVPSFGTPPFQRTSPHSADEPTGNLRYEVALGSRDLTAADRWRWLIQRPGDRPTGALFTHLVKEWCDHDFPDTSQWVKALPPGSEHDAAVQAVVDFLKWNRADDLVAEWEPPKR